MEKHERLRAARKLRFSKAVEAVEALGVSKGTYGNHEAGSRDFDNDTAERYARFFGVETAWLIFGKGEMKRGVRITDDVADAEWFDAQVSGEQPRRIGRSVQRDIAPEQPSAVLERLSALIARSDLSAEEVERLAGKPGSLAAIREKAGRGEVRVADVATLNALAKALNTTAAYLLTGVGAEAPGMPTLVAAAPPLAPPTDEVVLSRNRLVAAVYGGIAEAGTFREVDEFSDVAPRSVSALRDSDYPHARMVIFDVRGDSMNAYDPPITERTQLEAIDFESLGGRVPLFPGMLVVIERTRDGGHLREISIKQLEIFEDRYEFHPRSTNDRHKPIVVPHDMDADDGQTVRLLAWVRRISYRV